MQLEEQAQLAPLLLWSFIVKLSPRPGQNALAAQLCVLARSSCVDLTRDSQTAWRQPRDVTHSRAPAFSAGQEPEQQLSLVNRDATQVGSNKVPPTR
ncbi:hypothetical protein KOW79_008521 [Hemibagrus wyckioides]|uniref:Uncharacterized protein n=1 Tax=Hemibagrus wyckioides TaxID=337641 RepID=A0A9D3NX91_9TELE|nr:hypothetical protein KOW79_008521 [Hemibagrus wyckioides]